MIVVHSRQFALKAAIIGCLLGATTGLTIDGPIHLQGLVGALVGGLVAGSTYVALLALGRRLLESASHHTAPRPTADDAGPPAAD
ncbi:hypothetical protein B1756_08590 [Natrarchaeobaculum aegyptiacum]|uniref:Uncharacterized protein n=1 Tax=Natrarchaeobaculum aegyptiacum TaxID=745377 RepID=A0A2Z2HRK5_9EURY|nr:hypothetical protein B1756_08590 [Natrarchaeobaculum aegyptiacum]